MTLETFPSGAQLLVVSGPVGDHEEHWDPQGTGNPLLDVSQTDSLLSPSFTVGELARSGETRFAVARIDPEFVACLQALRDLVGAAVKVTSGYRSWGYNEKIYARRDKKPTLSRHCCGQAADVTIAGLDGLEIAKAAIDACGTNIAVGIGKNDAHIDIRGTWTRWTYLSGDDDRQAIEDISTYRRSRKQSLFSGTAGEHHRRSDRIDVARAVVRNRVHAERLGWASSRAEIVQVVGIGETAPTEEAFAEAVAAWQLEQGLDVDGIVGNDTWSRIQDLISGDGSS